MDHNQAMELVVAVLGTAPLQGNRLGAHKLTFQLAFAHSRRVSFLLVLAVVAGPIKGRSAVQLPNRGQTWAPVDFHAAVFRGRVCGRAVSPVDLESASPPIIARYLL